MERDYEQQLQRRRNSQDVPRDKWITPLLDWEVRRGGAVSVPGLSVCACVCRLIVSILCVEGVTAAAGHPLPHTCMLLAAASLSEASSCQHI